MEEKNNEEVKKTDKQEYFKHWSNKYALSIEEVEEEYEKILKDEQEIHSDLSEEQRNERALRRQALSYKKRDNSSAESFEGIVIGMSDAIDVIARKRKEAIAFFKSDPQTAVNEGVTDEEGNPLETRAEWASGKANQNFGKPLPETSYLRNVYGLASKNGDKDIKFFSITFNGTKAKELNAPMFESVKFMAIDKSTDGNSFKLNASQFTNFTKSDSDAEFDIESLLMEKCPIVKIKDLASYHAINKDDFNRLAVVVGDVSSLNLELTSIGNKIMSIENPESTIEDFDAEGVTCWLPGDMEINFAEGSRVMVVGRTSQGKLKDKDGNLTEELGSVSMNVLGVYAIPKFLIKAPSVEKITENNL